jgi:hypothetical protein
LDSNIAEKEFENQASIEDADYFLIAQKFKRQRKLGQEQIDFLLQ